MKEFDIIVLGGGMVGAAAALGLAKQGKRVAMIERAPPMAFSASQPMDLRVSAISHASVNLLKSFGVWSYVSQMRLCPYRAIETWEDPQCKLRFDVADLDLSDLGLSGLDLSELGFIVENRVIQLALWKGGQNNANLTVFSGAQLVNILADKQGHLVELETGEMLHGSWLIGADGAHSQARDYAKIGVTSWDYRQHCLLINVETEQPQQDTTWQWFTPKGPRAFLPLPGHHGSVVWYDNPSRINRLRAMSSTQLRAEILTHFPRKLGDISVCQQGSFPLTRRHAQRYYQGGVCLLGDAAHTINPLAGQGVNLGFKDVKALLEAASNLDPDSNLWGARDKVFAAYQRARKLDNLLMQTGMDLLYAGFTPSIVPLKILRNIGFKVAQNSGPLKRQVLKYAMGI